MAVDVSAATIFAAGVMHFMNYRFCIHCRSDLHTSCIEFLDQQPYLKQEFYEFKTMRS